KVNGEVLLRKGSIVVKEIVVEKLNTVANHQLLYQLSSRSGGKLFYPNELKKLQDDILKNQLIKPVTYSTNLTTSIIDLKWIFFIILFILGLEWFLRKRFATI
ncbi:MAG: VWA domain-containing protein, partial [Bacteroidia bacterium]